MRLAPLYNVLVKSWGASGRLGHHAANATTQPVRHVPAMQLIAKVRLNLLIVLLHFSVSIYLCMRSLLTPTFLLGVICPPRKHREMAVV